MLDRRPGGRFNGLLRLSLSVLLLAMSGCGGPAPTASPSPTAGPSPTASPSRTPVASADTDAIYDAIETQVSDIRGWQPKTPVAREVIDEDELRTMITEQFDAESPPSYVTATERLYKALGLLPADADLRELTLDLLSGGVVGVYRDDRKTLYVVSKTGAPGPNEQITFAHEFDHALQDQHTTVFKDQEGILDQSDRILARQATYEGDASLLMTQWAATHFDLADMAELLAQSSDPETLALLNRMPAILRETLVFPYQDGLSFVQATQAGGGWDAVDALYDRMPESTEQILHPDAYRGNEHPVEVDLPDDLDAQLGTGWTAPLEDTLGEFQLGIWLREHGVDTTAAEAATSGWGGDRVAVVEGPDDAWGVVLETTWDSARDTTEFVDAAQAAVDDLDDPARVSAPVGQTVTVLVASDEATLLALDVLFGATGV
jgi:hypothetical protein